ncbi:MAG TPA: glycosyltransferase family 2 protein [Bacteroidales bacterium]|nr:glycosyltransferase family 2 protein [Bacteroidales bacterium]
MELSVIIVSFNVSDFLKQCLHSVIKASCNIDCEIFVVDNNSADDSCEIVEHNFPEITLIRNKINTGFSAANNQAIKLSKGKYVLLLNPDTIVEENTFSKCISFMNNHPGCGALGVRMTDGEGEFLPESKRALPTLPTAFFKTFGISFLFPRSRVFNRYHLPHIGRFETARIDVISGAFMFIRHNALDKAGLLDEDFFMYGEDIDLSYRLLKTGYNNYYFADTQITHFKGKSTVRNNFEDISHFYRAMRTYIRKRSEERDHKLVYRLITPAIYLRQGLAVANRVIKIVRSENVIHN